MAIKDGKITFEGETYSIGTQDRVAAEVSAQSDSTYTGTNTFNRLSFEGSVSGSSGAVPWAGLSHGGESLEDSIAMISGNTTLGATHYNKTIIQTAASVVTLPAVAIGVSFVIVNGAADGTLLTVSPNSNDKFLIDIAGGAGTDNKDLVNTAATAKRGDYVHITYGSGDGWTILSRGGVWVDQS